MHLITLTPNTDIATSLTLRSPGAVLMQDYLNPQRLSAMRLARRTGIRATNLREIFNEKRRLTAEEALRLAAVLGTSGFYWLALQARYDLDEEWRRGWVGSGVW
jgi:antitoxin HigA-1